MLHSIWTAFILIMTIVSFYLGIQGSGPGGGLVWFIGGALWTLNLCLAFALRKYNGRH